MAQIGVKGHTKLCYSAFLFNTCMILTIKHVMNFHSLQESMSQNHAIERIKDTGNIQISF